MERVDAATLAAALERGEAVFDNRSATQYARDGLPGSLHLTLEQVQAGHLPALERTAPLHLVCAWGTVSEVVALYLEAAGFERVRVLRGGMAAWQALVKDATPDRGRR
jgi:rhodanese-related sulfurtransferase